jgi:hypothetical protein
VRLLERRKAYLQDRLDEGRRTLSSARRRRADTYTLSLMRHGVDVTERDIDWLDELIAAERTSSADEAKPADQPAQAPPQAGDRADVDEITTP